MNHTSQTMPLGIGGFSYADLHVPARLRDLHDIFCREVEAADPQLWAEWDVYRLAPDAARSPLEHSDLIVRMAPHLSRFVGRLFRIESATAGLVAGTTALDPLFRFKIDFVRKRALPLVKNAEKAGTHLVVTPEDMAVVSELARPWMHLDHEMAVAHAGCALLDEETAARETAGGVPDEARAQIASRIESLKRWCAACLHDPRYRDWVVFRFPETLDYFNLVQIQRPRPELPEAMLGPDSRLRRRDGFGLTDPRWRPREVISEIHYCVLCHERDKDSCSKGLRDKQGAVANNPLGIPLPGCPLDEKISEMHMVRKAGDAIGALAIVIIDNPMVPGTGHRICNDCMKACIYQKQDPVNIPQIETGVLTDVLQMPWGVEVYGLLTRWNPLNVKRPYALPYNGKDVLVVGLGPAGYTLAHYLLNEGFGVVAIDGLKIEPLPAEYVTPIEKWDQIYNLLDERVLEGFGGVSEYGITVRWDKNFLTLIHLTLARRDRLRIYGGVRFGGTMPIADAWAYGFDHIAIAAGAGRPTVIDMKNNLVRGVRKASDFLMALQLTGAFKRGAFPNLQARLPAVVIGGGLTGIDTATELFAYYPVQVEKVLERFETLCAERGEPQVRAGYDADELGILDEFLEHGGAVRAERARANAAGEPPNFVGLVRSWGGVTLAYRKRMVDSPAYRLNHEEVVKALEEGIWFAENLDPKEIIVDGQDHAQALVCRGPNGSVELPARTVLVAAGTSPNVTYEKELPGTFQLDDRKRFFQGFRAERTGDGLSLVADPAGFFTSHNDNGRLISYYGDNHPRYAGNVVKAMASAKDGYRHVTALFADDLRALDPAAQGERDAAWSALVDKLNDELLARVERVERLTETIIEVVVRAPAAARHFRPGQFYRLQNFEALTARAGDDIPLLMEGIALTGAWVDREAGLLSLIALEMGVSSRLCAYLRAGEPVVVMGPTGTPTEIPRGESVLLAGGGLGNAVLFSIAKALRENGNKVLYFAGYKKGEDLFKREDIERSTDQVIWSTDMGVEIAPGRPQDAHFRGNIVQAMIAYGRAELTTPVVPLSDVTRIIAIGSDRMMAAVKAARYAALAPFIRKDHVAIASINSPMQCMMKEICAQCLQKHVDPATGKEEFIFSCFNQDQEMDRVDFPNLNARLRQNTVQEKLSGLWLDHLLESADLEHV